MQSVYTQIVLLLILIFDSLQKVGSIEIHGFPEIRKFLIIFLFMFEYTFKNFIVLYIFLPLLLFYLSKSIRY